MSNSETTYVSANVPSKLEAQLMKIADENGRNRSQELIEAIKAYIQLKGSEKGRIEELENKVESLENQIDFMNSKFETLIMKLDEREN